MEGKIRSKGIEESLWQQTKIGGVVIVYQEDEKTCPVVYKNR